MVFRVKNWSIPFFEKLGFYETNKRYEPDFWPPALESAKRKTWFHAWQKACTCQWAYFHLEDPIGREEDHELRRQKRGGHQHAREQPSG